MLKTALLLSIFSTSDAYGGSAPSGPAPVATPQYAQECLAGFGALQFNVYAYSRYPEFFHDNSSVTLSQAGTYFGAGDIEEYMRFGSDTSPWVIWQGDPLRVDFTIQMAETSTLTRENKCVFVQAYQQVSITTPITFNISIDRAVFVKHYFDKAAGKVDRMIVYFDVPWFEFFFGLITGPQALRFTCNVMRNECGHKGIFQHNGWTTVAQCEAAMAALPVFLDTEYRYIDGLTSSCRQLHTAFAIVNDKHCPHLSIRPMEDVNGNFKCQTSQNLVPTDYFNPTDMAFWHRFKERIGLDYGTFSEPKPRIACQTDSQCPGFQYCGSEGCIFGQRKVLGDRLIANIWDPFTIPLTESLAKSQGWLKVGGNDSYCDWLTGRRYRFNNHLHPTLSFDNTGHLVGMQMAVDTTTFPLYPESNLRSPPLFQATGDGPTQLSMALYFKDPERLCTASPNDHIPGVLGDRFWMRRSVYSNQQADFTVFPLEESEIVGGSPANGYLQGGCAPHNWGGGHPGVSPYGMGTHYWQYLSPSGDMSWEDCYISGPVALMYGDGPPGKGTLQTFSVLTVGSKGRVSTDGGITPQNPLSFRRHPGAFLWEFPNPPFYPFFFTKRNQPDCLAQTNLRDGTLKGNTTVSLTHFAFKDTRTLSCTPPALPSKPPPYVAPPASPPLPPTSSDDDGMMTGSIVTIIALGVLSMLALGFAAWVVMKERAGQPAFVKMQVANMKTASSTAAPGVNSSA